MRDCWAVDVAGAKATAVAADSSFRTTNAVELGPATAQALPDEKYSMDPGLVVKRRPKPKHSKLRGHVHLLTLASMPVTIKVLHQLDCSFPSQPYLANASPNTSTEHQLVQGNARCCVPPGCSRKPHLVELCSMQP